MSEERKLQWKLARRSGHTLGIVDAIYVQV
jgi:hypothetical protein